MNKDIAKVKEQLNLNLLPEHILYKDFKTKVIKGYDPDDVNAFLDLVLADYKKLYEECSKEGQGANGAVDSRVTKDDLDALQQQLDELYQKIGVKK